MNLIGDPKKILIINLGGIGDLLLSLPALKAIRSRFPQAAITMLVAKRLDSFVRGLSCADDVTGLSISGRDRFSILAAPMNLFTLLGLRIRHFDLALNMRTLVSDESAAKIKLLLNIINPGSSAGRDTDSRGYFFDIKVPERLMGDKAEADYDADLVRALGAELPEIDAGIEADAHSCRIVDRLLLKEGVHGSDVLVGIHPGGLPSHRWPAENFTRFMNTLFKDRQAEGRQAIFVITGDRNDLKLADAIAKKSSIKAINLAGRLTMPELAALLRRCSLFISNDTGPMHIAAMLKVPQVAIFGPGYIKRYDPSRISDKAAVLRKSVECSPCDKPDCKDLKCLKAVTVDEVLAAARQLLKFGAR
jgi:ADP-heptose:LPS heptosyltransferase